MKPKTSNDEAPTKRRNKIEDIEGETERWVN
jgi:hypothetical protein